MLIPAQTTDLDAVAQFAHAIDHLRASAGIITTEMVQLELPGDVRVRFQAWREVPPPPVPPGGGAWTVVNPTL